MLPIPVDQALSIARQHWQAGRVAMALDLCREVLRAVPEQPDALYLMGIAAAEGGKPEHAAALFSRLGDALRAAGQPAEAVTAYDEAIRLDAAQSVPRWGRALALAPQFPAARLGAFEDFSGRYEGQACYVIGRGSTGYDYEQLRSVEEPIFFINDAVCLEKHARGETFFFAHDPQLLPWLDGALRSTAVLPVDGELFQRAPATLAHSGGLVFYRWSAPHSEHLLSLGRGEIAASKELFRHSGTIHSLLHFAWFCGFRRVSLIGCDGLPPAAAGYDPRLRNRSASSPGWLYPTIRSVQDQLMETLGLEAHYCGTPDIAEGPA